MSESLDARLKRLPPRRAPASLMAATLAAAALYRQPWHRRPFWTWTAGAQAAFVAAVAAGACALIFAGEPAAARVWAFAGQAWSWTALHFGWAAALARALTELMATARLPLLLLASLCAAPAAALAGLAANLRRTR